MLDSLITSETRIKLLLKFFLNPANRSYLRQLANEFEESTNGIRVELNRLKAAKILESKKEGRNVIYRANHKHPLFQDIRQIVLKSTGIDKVLANITEKLGNIHTAFIRGDYAAGRDSGLIELVVVGNDINIDELERVRKKTEKLINRKIALIILKYTEYKKLKNKFDDEGKLILLDGKS